MFRNPRKLQKSLSFTPGVRYNSCCLQIFRSSSTVISILKRLSDRCKPCFARQRSFFHGTWRYNITACQIWQVPETRHMQVIHSWACFVERGIQCTCKPWSGCTVMRQTWSASTCAGPPICKTHANLLIRTKCLFNYDIRTFENFLQMMQHGWSLHSNTRQFLCPTVSSSIY